MTPALDTLYTAETPEGVSLSMRPAGVTARCLAYLIDLAIRLAMLFAASLVLGALGGFGGAIFLVFYFLLEWFYPVAFELGLSGATPGKRAMGLQVVMDSGLPVTPAASITRNLLRAADFLPALYGAGALCLLLRADFKRLGDLAAGTLVVYRETVVLHGQMPDAEPVAPARALGASEQAAIVSWAGRATRLTPERFGELAALAQSATSSSNTAPTDAAAAPARLLGVAQWLMGRRA